MFVGRCLSFPPTPSKTRMENSANAKTMVSDVASLSIDCESVPGHQHEMFDDKSFTVEGEDELSNGHFVKDSVEGKTLAHSFEGSTAERLKSGQRLRRRGKSRSTESSKIRQGHCESECEKCGKAFQTVRLLKHHLKRCRNQSESNKEISKHKSPFVCGICLQTFVSLESLCSHPCKSEGESGEFKCSVCSEAFKTAEHLVRHTENHDIPKPYKCGLCNQAFHENSLLLEHVSNQHPDLKKTFFYSCKHCAFKCSIISELKKHVESSHTSAAKLFKCGICGKGFSTKKTFTRHIASHKELSLINISAKCDHSHSMHNFKSKLRGKKRKVEYKDSVHEDSAPYIINGNDEQQENLSVHHSALSDSDIETDKADISETETEEMRTGGSDVQTEPLSANNFDCYECGLRFPSKKSILEHRKVHGSNPNYSIYCQQCSKSFGSLNLLKSHLTDFGCPGYQCKLCPEVFALESLLHVHKAKVHIDSNEEQLTCDKCLKSFSTISQFSRHAGSHAEKNFLCKHCDNKFASPDHLFAHLKKIHGITREKCVRKVVQCKVCKKEFADASALKVHSQYHLEEVSIKQESEEKMVDCVDDDQDEEMDGKDCVIGNMNESFDCDVCGDRLGNVRAFVKHRNEHFFTGKFSIQCDSCRDVFSSISSIKEHVKTKKCAGFQCTKCKCSFALQTTLLIHVAKEHDLARARDNRKKVWSCLKCHKTLVSKEAYIRHAAIHADVKSFKCNLCDSWYTTVEYVQTHLRHSHRPIKDLEENSVRHSCAQCSSTFLSAEALENHQSYHNQGDETVGPDNDLSSSSPTESSSYYSCSNCPKVFWKYNALVKHRKSHFKSLVKKKKSFTCSTCKKSFRENYELQRHMGTHTRPYLCSSCGKSFSLPWALKEHMKAYHSNENPYKCEFCEKTYSTSNSLRLHRRIHTGEKNFRCEFCDKVFVDLSYLKSHLKSHFPDKPHKCTICSYSSKHKSGLSRHMLSHRQEKKHFCPVCDKAFTQKGHVKTHMKLHSKVKNHICSVCGSAFARQDYLKIHMRVHTNEKPYSCPVCSRAFAMSSNMLSHIKKTHPDYSYQYKHLQVNYDKTPSTSAVSASGLSSEPTVSLPENTRAVRSTGVLNTSSSNIAQTNEESPAVCTVGQSISMTQPIGLPASHQKTESHVASISSDTPRPVGDLSTSSTSLATETQQRDKPVPEIPIGGQHMINQPGMLPMPQNVASHGNRADSTEMARFTTLTNPSAASFVNPGQDYMYIYPNFPQGPYMQDFLQPYHKP